MNGDPKKQDFNEQLRSFCKEGKRVSVLLKESRSYGNVVIDVGYINGYKFIESLNKTTLFLTFNMGNPVLDVLFSSYHIYDAHPVSFVKNEFGNETHVFLNNTCQDIMRSRIGVLELLKISPSAEEKIMKEFSSGFSLENCQAKLDANMFSEESLEVFQMAWQNIAKANKQNDRNVVVDNLYLILSSLQKEITVFQSSSPETFSYLNSWCDLMETKAAQIEADQVKVKFIMDVIFPLWFLNVSSKDACGDN